MLIACCYLNFCIFNLKEMELSHMDEFIDELLREERACDVILPRIQVTVFSCSDTGRTHP